MGSSRGRPARARWPSPARFGLVMSVLDRASLEESPLADLHAIASELSIDGYRRLRKEQLIDSIMARQEGKEPSEPAAQEDEHGDEEEARPRRRRGRRGGRSRATAEEDAEDEEAPSEEPEQQIVEGEVEVLPNGSGFVRAHPPEQSEDDVYVSAAQVRRCELITGDRITGPVRPRRRSERFASLHRVDTINGQPAAELADRPHFDELPTGFPDQRLELSGEDPTLEAIDRLTPIGMGSRVTISGAARAGKTELLRRVTAALGRREDLQLFLVLVGIRPEELSDWPVAPAQALSFASPIESQDQALGAVVDQARRVAARGGNAVVLIDTLDGPHSQPARRALAAARNLTDSGSVTVIATASGPLGGETTVIALDSALAAAGSWPALDLPASGTIRPELLVGEDGAAAIVAERLGATDPLAQ
jgi:transcription termination factor Rho